MPSHAYFDERGRVNLHHRGDQTITFRIDEAIAGLNLSQTQISGAFSDAVVIDTSTVIFDGGRIQGARNDGINLMSSKAVITGMTISNSGDKGVSVGERTRVLIHNTRLAQNKIAVESKDDSTA